MSIITLLSPRRPMSASPAPRRFLGRLAAGLRGLTLSSAPSQSAPVAAPEPANLFTADELPALADIEAAAAQFAKAADLARAGDRGKRAAKKVLDRLPTGMYGRWVVRREASNRMTADLDAIRATYKRLGLGEVPMKASAPSLKVEQVPAAELVTV